MGLRELTLRKKVDYLDLADARDEDYPAIALVSAVRKFTG